MIQKPLLFKVKNYLKNLWPIWILGAVFVACSPLATQLGGVPRNNEDKMVPVHADYTDWVVEGGVATYHQLRVGVEPFHGRRGSAEIRRLRFYHRQAPLEELVCDVVVGERIQVGEYCVQVQEFGIDPKWKRPGVLLAFATDPCPNATVQYFPNSALNANLPGKPEMVQWQSLNRWELGHLTISPWLAQPFEEGVYVFLDFEDREGHMPGLGIQLPEGAQIQVGRWCLAITKVHYREDLHAVVEALVTEASCPSPRLIWNVEHTK